LILAVLLLAASGCSRKANPPFQRIAVLRFENLTPDAGADWMGRAIAEILTVQISASRTVHAISPSVLQQVNRLFGSRSINSPGVSSERMQALAAGANRLVYGQFALVNGRLRVDAVIEDPAARTMVQTLSASGPANEGIIPLADALARRISPESRAFGTRSQQALREYVAVLESPDANGAAARLAAAIQADANFGQAYVAQVQLAIAQKDRATAERVLAEARARGASIPEQDRLRLLVEEATMRGDSASRERALRDLIRVYPSDPALHRNLGELALNRHEYDKGAAYLSTAALIRPDDPTVLNLLGYAEAYRGDLRAAVNVLRRYEKLRPDEANPLDSLGDVHFHLGQFSEAEQFYLKAHEKNPGFLSGGDELKAAHARLMTGDLTGADKLFEKYIEGRRATSDAAIDYRKAEWWWITGKRSQALSTLEAFARAAGNGSLRGLAARAYAQLALWNLELGGKEPARQLSAKAGELAASEAGGVAVIRFLAEPDTSPTEWAVRAERMFADSSASLKDFAVAYALLFSREFERAVPVLRQIYQRSGLTSAPGVPVLLAWAYIETDRYQDAAPLLRPNPIPEPTGLALFDSLHFPRLFYLRARMLEHSRKREEAKQYYRFFLNLSGEQPLKFGEEQRAQQALSAS
jgi:Flp pilus assembly protein TadD